MNYRNSIINPEAPKETTSHGWDDERDGWEGMSMVSINEQVAYTCDHVGQFAEIISAIKNSKLPLAILADTDIRSAYEDKIGKPLSIETELLIRDVLHLFNQGYREGRNRYVNAMKAILNCKGKSLSFDPRAGKIGPSQMWVRGTGTHIGSLSKMTFIHDRLHIVADSQGKGGLRVFFEFNYVSTSELQSWADTDNRGLTIARSFAAAEKHKESNRIGVVLHAKIPDNQMVLSTQFTDTVKPLLKFGAERESIRLSSSPLHSIAEITFMGEVSHHVSWVESRIVPLLKEKRDISIVNGWLKKNKHII